MEQTDETRGESPTAAVGFWTTRDAETEALKQKRLATPPAHDQPKPTPQVDLSRAADMIRSYGLLVSEVVAMSIDNVIGIANRLPWYIPSDLKRFKRLTEYRTLIVGAATWAAMPYLENRDVIPIGRTRRIVNGAMTVTSISEAIERAGPYTSREVMVIGGRQIFMMFRPLVVRHYVTIVQQAYATGSDEIVSLPSIATGKRPFLVKHIESTPATINQPATLFKVTAYGQSAFDAGHEAATQRARKKAKQAPSDS